MISFIIPARNEEKRIEKTLQGLSLCGIPHEIIVADDDSQDRTADIARKYTDKIINCRRRIPRTIAGVRNAGAREARGEYLVFIDADTRIKDPEVFFPKAEKIFRDDQDIVALTVFIRVSKEAETLADKIILGFFNYLFLIMNNFLSIGASSGEFQMIRADAFRKIGGFNENLVTGEDHDMFRRLARIGKTHLEKSLAAYHDGRRAHAIGWPKLLWLWTRDAISILLFKKSASKIWERVC
jgi:glycosyltransferase involved in cell wall biosynthesis